MDRDEKLLFKIVIGILGIVFGYFGATSAFDIFRTNGVTPDVAAGSSVAIFALILGALGLIAVKVDL